MEQSGRKEWQPWQGGPPDKRLKQAKSVAVGCR
jgi:hypothetical protein